MVPHTALFQEVMLSWLKRFLRARVAIASFSSDVTEIATGSRVILHLNGSSYLTPGSPTVLPLQTTPCSLLVTLVHPLCLLLLGCLNFTPLLPPHTHPYLGFHNSVLLPLNQPLVDLALDFGSLQWQIHWFNHTKTLSTLCMPNLLNEDNSTACGNLCDIIRKTCCCNPGPQKSLQSAEHHFPEHPSPLPTSKSGFFARQIIMAPCLGLMSFFIWRAAFALQVPLPLPDILLWMDR